MKKILLLLSFSILLIGCSKNQDIEINKNIEDKSIKVSGNVIYCDELPEGSFEQCEIRY